MSEDQEAQEEKATKVTHSLLQLLVVAHFAVLFGNVAAFFILPFSTEWYVWLPLCSWLFRMALEPGRSCPLTKWENLLRKRLGKRQIGGFVGHYFLKPLLGPRRDVAREQGISDGHENDVWAPPVSGR